MAEHVLPFDVEAALLYGPLVAAKERAGLAMDPMDAQIACIAACRGAMIATRNERDSQTVGCGWSTPGATRCESLVDPLGIEAMSRFMIVVISPGTSRARRSRLIAICSMLIRIARKIIKCSMAS